MLQDFYINQCNAFILLTSSDKIVISSFCNIFKRHCALNATLPCTTLFYYNMYNLILFFFFGATLPMMR